MAVKILFLLFGTFSLQPGLLTQEILPEERIFAWADNIGSVFSDKAAKWTGYSEVWEKYMRFNGQIVVKDGPAIVQKLRDDLRKMLFEKVTSVSKLVDRAESYYRDYDGPTPSKSWEYNNMKKLRNKTNETVCCFSPPEEKGFCPCLTLEPRAHYNYVPVDLNTSSVHVPTNVFDHSQDILDGVKWSQDMDSAFKQNTIRDPSLLWQYFGSHTGFYRVYPAYQWPETAVDLFDCRTRGWYVEAASSPKDLLIMVDQSGSMTGKRMAIAKFTVSTILDTLSEDDYFNVMNFSKTATFLDPECFNGSLIQATEDSKKRIRLLASQLETNEMSNYSNALEHAFKFFADVDERKEGSGCNRAIMIISDGAPGVFEDIFKKYNPKGPRHIRVFTFLIGREISFNAELLSMACSNRGYYAHISTLADVQENVMEYITVLSRPMVINNTHDTTWTSVYIDKAHEVPHEIRELRLMTSISQPVFDRRNATKYRQMGQLLGVVGVDVPLREFRKSIPFFKIGANGYAFGITNNGYILFHPGLKHKRGFLKEFESPKFRPHFKSVDMVELEFEVYSQNSSISLKRIVLGNATANITEFSDLRKTFQDLVDNDLPNVDLQLRTAMVNGTTGSQDLYVKRLLSNMTRAIALNQTYHYTAIPGTPFSIAVVIPEGIGEHLLDFATAQDDVTSAEFAAVFCDNQSSESMYSEPTLASQCGRNDRVNAFEMADIIFANWNYCDVTADDVQKPETEDPGEMPRSRQQNMTRLLDLCHKGDQYCKDNCNQELIRHIFFDARLTRTMLATWKSLRTLHDSDGIEFVFVSTQGGLTRYLKVGENTTNPTWLLNSPNTVEESYYQRAVAANGDTVFGWHTESSRKKPVITMSQAVFISNSNFPDQRAPVAVVGAQMKYDNFDSIFATTCENGETLPECTLLLQCNPEKGQPGVYCYLLDENAYVVYSSNASQVGKFFPEVDFLSTVVLTQTNIFKWLNFTDYQAVCDTWEPLSSAAITIIHPFKLIFGVFCSVFQTVIFASMQVGVWCFWSLTALVKNTFADVDLPPECSSKKDKEFWDCIRSEPEILAKITSDALPTPPLIRTSQYLCDVRFSRLIRGDVDSVFEHMPDCQNCSECNHTWPDHCSKQPKEKNWTKFRQCLADREKARNRPPGELNMPPQECTCYGDSVRGDRCTKSIAAKAVTGTNLVLVVTTRNCECLDFVSALRDMSTSSEQWLPSEVNYTKEEQCAKLRTTGSRRNTKRCYNYQKEESSECGIGSNILASSSLVFMLMLLVFFMNSHQHVNGIM